ncbi:unnamed protein product [Rhodiola kirilowii]
MEIVQKEIQKLLDADVIYPISDSQWVSPVHMVPKKSGITVEKCQRKNGDNKGQERLENVHRLHKIKRRHKKRPFPSAIHRPNARPTGGQAIFLLPRRVLRLQPDPHSA